MAAAALTALRKRLSRRLAGEVGGPRRLHALVTAAALTLPLPLSLTLTLTPTRNLPLTRTRTR